MREYIDLQLFADDEGAEGGEVDTGVTDSDAGSGDTSEEMISKSQATSAVQARVNELTPYRDLVKKLEQRTGLSRDQIAAYIEKAGNQTSPTQSQTQNQNQSQQPDLNQIQQTSVAAAQSAWETRRLYEEMELKNDPMYSDYDEIKDEVRSYADNYGLKLREAYWAVNGSNRAEKLKQETEQRTIANLEKKRGLGVESDAVAQEMEEYGLTKEDMEMAKSLDISAKEWSVLKNSRGLDDYEKAMKEG